MLDNYNHPALVKEWKRNLDAAAYEKELDVKANKTLDKK